jgi:hypothetical protein
MVKIGMLRTLKNFLISKNIKEPIPRIAIYPYLSGDAFLSLADVCVLRDFSQPIYLRRKPPRIVFIETGLLRNLKMDSLFESAKVVIIHNGDEPLRENEISFLRKNNLAVYATNSSFENGFIEPIPIGIENAHHSLNGSLHYYNPLNLSQLNLHKKNDIFASFSVCNNLIERSRILSICESYGIKNEITSLYRFRLRLAESKFIISPPGNGIDCHRTWEAMYHKTIPVIEDQFNLFKHIELPVLSVPRINDFFALTKSERDRLYQRIIEEKHYPAIYFDYWQRRVLSPFKSL